MLLFWFYRQIYYFLWKKKAFSAHFLKFFSIFGANDEKFSIFALEFYTVVVAQLVRATDCGSVGRGFESRLPPECTDNKCFSLLDLF